MENENTQTKRRTKKKKTLLQKIIIFIWNIILILAVIVASLAVAFYFAITVGWWEKGQELWVLTAMSTKDHQYLATSIINEERIKQIQEENAPPVSDEHTQLTYVPYNEEYWLTNEEGYIEDGYTELEDGIWTKPVEGDGFKGQLMLIEDPSTVELVVPSNGDVAAQPKKYATQYDATAVINGGGYYDDGYQSTTSEAVPTGPVVVDGELLYGSIDDPKEYDIAAMTTDDKFYVDTMTTAELMELPVDDATSFGPTIIVNGIPLITNGDGGQGINPRTAVGQMENGEMLFLVIDGRQPNWSVGATLLDVQEIMVEAGATDVSMMDGGASSVMLYHNEELTYPCNGVERYVPNAWIVQKD